MKRHFTEVVAELGARDVAHLGEEQRVLRRSLLDELATYGRRGRFPRNLDFIDRKMPYFVDAAGTRCAVAHLLDATGSHALVDRITRSKNNAFVRELGGDAELGAWAARAGLTLQELGRIQPAYCDTAANMCFCSYRPAAPAGIDGTVVAMNEHATIRIDAVYGDASVATVGSEIVIGDADVFAVGDKVIAGFDPDFAIFHVHRIVDGMVDSSCGPELSKEDGLAAIKAEGGCTEYLVALDEAWSEEECRSVGDDGCSTSSAVPLGVPPLLLGVCAVAVGVWAQRCRLRRRRKARARAQVRQARTPYSWPKQR